MATAAETTPNTPFYKLGGHETIQAICNRFYDLMDIEPAYREGDGGMADAALIAFGELVEDDAAGFLDGDAARHEIIGK